MARPPLATIADLEALLGSTVDDTVQALARLDRASAIVRAFAGVTWLNEDETALEDVPADIPGVVAGMVERASRNPEGVTQETAGEFSRSFGSDAAKRIYLDWNDKLVIRAAIGASGSGIGVLTTTRGEVETRDVGTIGGTLPTEDLASLHTALGGS